MKIIRKERAKNGRRRIYICGVKVFSYRRHKATPKPFVPSFGLTVEEAVAQGYHTVYFFPESLGDLIIARGAFETLASQLNQKILIGVSDKTLFETCDKVAFLKGGGGGYYSEEKFKVLEEKGLTPVFLMYFDKNKTNKGSSIVWCPRHIFQVLSERMGVKGRVKMPTCLNLFASTPPQSNFHFFNKNQIVIASGGKYGGRMKYKVIPESILQEIVDALAGEYNFVQVGEPDNPPLNGVLDKRGVPLAEVAAIIRDSDLYVGAIGGLMHLAYAMETPAVIGHTAGEPLNLTKHACNTHIIPKVSCPFAKAGTCYGYAMKCEREFECIRSLKAKEMIQAIRKHMAHPKKFYQDEFDMKPQSFSMEDGLFFMNENKKIRTK